MVEDPTSNKGHTTFKKNQDKSKWIIYDSMKDNLIHVITPLNTTKEYLDTLTNLYEKKDPS